MWLATFHCVLKTTAEHLELLSNMLQICKLSLIVDNDAFKPCLTAQTFYALFTCALHVFLQTSLSSQLNITSVWSTVFEHFS